MDRSKIPRCERMDGSTLSIVPAYTEAGKFKEANCVTITDGERSAVYVPLRAADRQVHTETSTAAFMAPELAQGTIGNQPTPEQHAQMLAIARENTAALDELLSSPRKSAPG